MNFALQAAGQVRNNDLPIGAAVIDLSTDELVGSAANQVLYDNDLTSHAELVLLRGLGRSRTLEKGGKWLLAVTLEPCPMCAWAIRRSGIKTIAFGARNDHFGAAGSVFDILRDTRIGPSNIEVFMDVESEKSASLLREKFEEIRGNLL